MNTVSEIAPSHPGLTADEVRTLSEHGVMRSVAEGAAVLNGAESADSLTVVLEGRIEAFTTDALGRKIAFASLGPGACFGGTSSAPRPSAPSLVAREPTQVLVVSASALRALLLQHPPFALRLAEIFARETARLADEVEARARDLSEALEQQRATSEILRVISSSPTDLQPVFDIIAESAVRLCGAQVSTVTTFDGELVHLGAIYGSNPAGIEALRRAFPMPPSGAGGAARAIRERAIIQIPDVMADQQYKIQGAALSAGFHALLAVPMMREGRAIGAITVGRAQAGGFSDTEVQLLGTFAEQAIIAIENVRLFGEVQDKGRQVEEQAAQLAEWNRTLETRVAEQVSQLGRMNKLTRFLSPKISDLIMSGQADDPLKTSRAEITVVYVDLRGFTGFTETADPEEVMSVLREYHAELGRAIMAYDGTIEHFAGDGAMILFNAPMPVKDHEMQAIRMTLQMRKALVALSVGWRKRGYALGFGAGLAGGYATIGTIGFEERLDYGAIGTVCNLAARLCGEASDGQILIAPRVFAKMEARIEAVPVGELMLKGFQRPVAAYNVLGIRSEDAG